MRNTPERHQQLGEFFTANHERLHGAVTRKVRARAELIDDACADAWTILLRRTDITLDQLGFRWLLTVAINEGLRLLRRTRGETPVGTFQADSRGHDDEDLPEPVDTETPRGRRPRARTDRACRARAGVPGPEAARTRSALPQGVAVHAGS